MVEKVILITCSGEFETLNIDVFVFIANRVAGFQSIPGGFIRAHNMVILSDIDIYECASKCEEYQSQVYDARCISFDYDNRNNKCYLSDKSIETVLHEMDWEWHPDFTYYGRGKAIYEYLFIYLSLNYSSFNFF